ncbi:MAG: metallophosphoesterase family protein [Desulfobacterales bacterium]
MKGNIGGTITRIGVISDTHGRLAPEIATIFKHIDMILHAGDIDDPEVLKRLNAIAPVTAVRGNMDRGKWAKTLPKTELISINDVDFYVLHDLHDLDIDPKSIGISAVIYGHTHHARITEDRHTILINPGSASLPRKGAAPSVAVISVHRRRIYPQIFYF